MTMKRIVMLLVICVSYAAAAANGQMATGTTAIAVGSQVDPSKSFDALLSGTEGAMISLVKAMPAEKYGFAPNASIFASSHKTDFTGVRTVRALAIHVATSKLQPGSRHRRTES